MKLWIYLIITGLAAWWWYNQNKTKKLKEDNILDKWSYLFPDAQGKGLKVFAEVKRFVEKLDPPHIILKECEVEGGTVRGNERKTMLTAENSRLAGYIMYVGARDYGKQMLVSWYLVHELTGVSRFRRIIAMHWALILFFLPYYLGSLFIEKMTGRVTAENMGVFEQEELAAYAGTVHSAVTQSAKEVAEELNIDFAKEDMKTRGFLNLP